MKPTVEDLFKTAVERYQAGEGPETLLPIFLDICDRAPKNSPAWTSLAWLYLLDNKPKRAYKAAQKAVKLNPEDLQARINLAIAMLETAQKGVRQHIETAQQLVAISELRQEALQNFEEGLRRRPDWQSLRRVQTWLLGS